MLITALILASAIVGALLHALYGKSRGAATGRPTPEDARVRHTENLSKIEATATSQKNEIGSMTDSELEREINRDRR